MSSTAQQESSEERNYATMLEFLRKGISKNIVSTALKTLDIKVTTASQGNRTTVLRNLKSNFKEENLVLVLGAGISLDYKIPTWNELLRRLLARALQDTNENQQVVATLFNSVFGPNALIAARYLKLHFDESNSPLEKEIQKVLYEFYEDTESQTLKAIKKLCISAGKAPGLDSVITYNYDEVLERTLLKADVGIKFKVISKTGQHAKNDELPIYHVHGHLPMNGKVENDDSLVLSDESYHRQYMDLYHWSNMVQINKFKDNNCLFIGHSFTDPNLRRLLDAAKKLRGNDLRPHYLIKCRHSKDEVINNIEKILRDSSSEFDEEVRNNIDNVASSLLETVHKFEEIDANSFGVNVIWIDNFDEIGPILTDLTQ
ncbi:SIR2 family protein [Enterobacter hormaechei]